jgi:hypothetical protein
MHAAPQPLYGVAIQRAAAGGDLKTMREVVQQAEQFVREHGDISAALEVLRMEIAKLEHRQHR